MISESYWRLRLKATLGILSSLGTFLFIATIVILVFAPTRAEAKDSFIRLTSVIASIWLAIEFIGFYATLIGPYYGESVFGYDNKLLIWFIGAVVFFGCFYWILAGISYLECVKLGWTIC